MRKAWGSGQESGISFRGGREFPITVPTTDFPFRPRAVPSPLIKHGGGISPTKIKGPICARPAGFGGDIIDIISGSDFLPHECCDPWVSGFGPLRLSSSPAGTAVVRFLLPEPLSRPSVEKPRRIIWALPNSVAWVADEERQRPIFGPKRL